MSAKLENSFTFINLIDTDQVYGHRQDPLGFGRCLEEFDRAMPAILTKLNEGDILFISGDHGNDPADDSTDHTREFVPILACCKGYEAGNNLGILNSFSDVSATVLDFYGLENRLKGLSFLDRICRNSRF